MNEVSLLTNATNQSELTSLGNNSMKKDEFLKLLVEQLKHQDPMSPMNSQDFASQLAQFSSLEQLTNMSGMMEESMQVDLMLTQAINNTMATTFIGKGVSASGNRISYVKDQPVEISFQLNSQAENVSVNILDKAGNVINKIKLGATPKGVHHVDWNGETENGRDVPQGEYDFQIIAEDSNGDSVDYVPMIKGIITGIKYTDGTAVFVVNDKEIPFNQVIEINQIEN
jgi:flagellar basal-body rod modification protein FlgD